MADDLTVLDEVKGKLTGHPHTTGRPFDLSVADIRDLVFLTGIAAVDGKLDIHLTSVPNSLYSMSLIV